MTTATAIDIAAGLKRPAAYPHRVDEVGFLQTHVSWLFFAGERVYKVKKPVDLGFLDFTTLERRKHFCEEEVRLNRRLAPGVHLGVVPITRTADGGLRVGGEGEPLDWAVEMVRLPAHRMLDAMLERGEVDNEKMNALAHLLAGFHRAAPTGPGVDQFGAPLAIAANVEENFEQLAPFVAHPDRAPTSGLAALTSRQLVLLRTRARGFLATHRDLLERRVAEGRIREGHGDLHAGNVCFRDGEVVAYDCIEFNRRFRCGDVAADLAFLAMDFDRRGYPGFSRYLVRRYAKATGDPALEPLMSFYKGYRAVVRGKVAALTAADPGLGAERREELRREAMRYLQLAVSYELPPAMVLMCGLPACGKSWIARRFAGTLRAVVLQSDVRRKVLTGTRLGDRGREGYDAGLYSPEMKRRTYRSLLERALESLYSGHSVIVDATFSKQSYRAPFVDAATRLGLPFHVVHVEADDAVIRARLERRAKDAREASDADLSVYLRARESFEPPDEVPGGRVLRVASGEGAPEEKSSLLIDRMIHLQGEASETEEGAR